MNILKTRGKMSAKIAIIEDDPVIAKMYKIKFESLKYNVKTANNGIEGLKLVESFRPDMVLLDLMMPQMDGTTMLKKMRATDWGKDTKVIIMTNMGETERPADLKDLNVIQTICKSNYSPRQVADDVLKNL